MDGTVVKNAIGPLDKLLREAKEALWDIEMREFGLSRPGGGFENPHMALKYSLEHLHDILLVVLEAATCPKAALRSLTDGVNSRMVIN
jgi:hypothetical protein